MLRLIARDLFIYQKRHWIGLSGAALVIVLLMRLAEPAAAFPVSMLIISLVALTMTAQIGFVYDEMFKSNIFLRSLPISPATLVLSRYGSCLIAALSGGMIVVMLTAFIKAISHFYPAWGMDFRFIDGAWVACLVIVLLFCAILLPIVFRFGYVKVKYPLIFLFAFLATAGRTLYADMQNSQWWTALQSSAPAALVYLLLLLISLLLLYGSIKLSLAIFSKKEY